jgi:integrase
LFALLACTGLRVSEAIRLRMDDITPEGLVIQPEVCTQSR